MVDHEIFSTDDTGSWGFTFLLRKLLFPFLLSILLHIYIHIIYIYICIYISLHYINDTLHISHRFIEHIHFHLPNACEDSQVSGAAWAGSLWTWATQATEVLERWFHGKNTGFLWENGGKTMENLSLKGDFYVISMGISGFLCDFYGISIFLGLQWDLWWRLVLVYHDFPKNNVHGVGDFPKRHGKDDTVAGQCGIIWCFFGKTLGTFWDKWVNILTLGTNVSQHHNFGKTSFLGQVWNNCDVD